MGLVFQSDNYNVLIINTSIYKYNKIKSACADLCTISIFLCWLADIDVNVALFAKEKIS